MSRTLRMFLLAVLLIGVSGCVQESTSGDTKSFCYELWVSLSIFFGGAVAAPVGWALRKSIPRLGWALMIFGPLAAVGFAPSMFFEKTTLTDKTLSVRSGIWGMTAVHDVNLDDLNQVRMIVEHSTGRRGRKVINYFLVCDLKNGMSVKIPVNNNVTQAAAPHFVAKLAERNIPFIDQT